MLLFRADIACRITHIIITNEPVMNGVIYTPSQYTGVYEH